VAAVKAASRATLLLSGVAIVLFLVSDRLAAELSSPGAPGLRIAALIGGLATSGGWLGAMAVIRAGRRPTIRWLSLAALVPAPLFLVAAAHAGGAVAYGIGAAVVIGRAAGHRRQRDTDEGLRAASASAGSSGKGPSPTFRRPLSPCGSATSRTPRPSRSPPRRSGTCRWARTRIGGRGARTGGEWRLVRIRYPSFWPPAWGWRPRVALIVSVVGAVVASVALRLAAGIGWLEASAAHPPGLVALVRGLFVSFLTMGTILALWSLSTLARAVMDLGRPQSGGAWSSGSVSSAGRADRRAATSSRWTTAGPR
jgi:hypothetical protein